MPNFDEKTGIRYGVISPHSLGEGSEYDLYEGPNCTDPQYEESKREINAKIDSLFEDIGYLTGEHKTSIRDELLDAWNDNYQGDGDGQMDYSDKEYSLHVSCDNFGIFVMKSPYYTYCRNCSPCAPGAGDLNNPIDVDGGVPRTEKSPVHMAFKSCCTEKTYCLGPEWFDKEDNEYSQKIPYRVFRVDNDEEVV